MLDKLFGWGRKKEEESAEVPEKTILFGRYSDNNKTRQKIARWTDADNLFKEKKHPESITAFFDYLKDDAVNNVTEEQNGNTRIFTIHQGSKTVKVQVGPETLAAEVSLAQMPEPGVAVMRRLLDQNFNLYYSRYALDGNRLCMRFESDVTASSPNKLYYGLRELATKADKQDDLLVQDFQNLKSIDTAHIAALPENEKEIRYKYLKQWIAETLDMIAAVDADKFSGGISYLLLTLIYRIDFLVMPEGALLRELEAINSLYWLNDNRQATEKNRDMMEAFRKIGAKTAEEVYPSLFLASYTFSIVAPTAYKNISDSIQKANNNAIWYRDNQYPGWAAKVVEYGLAWCQYSFSLPRPLTEIFTLFMRVNNPGYFKELGLSKRVTDDNGLPVAAEISAAIKGICAIWKEKYPKLDFNTVKLKYDSLANFNFSFTGEVELLNFDS
jgi:hypothetical protein